MHDPIAAVIDRLKRNPAIRRAAASDRLKANFLNNVGEIFETYGFATARQFLIGQSERRELAEQAGAVLEALQCMEGCEPIHRNRAIGRLLIKTLRQIGADYDRQGARK